MKLTPKGVSFSLFSFLITWTFHFAGGPFNMAEMNKATVHASERVSARDMIQTQFEGDEDLSLMTDKDVAKMKKKAEKDERAARAALAAHQVRPAHPYICHTPWQAPICPVAHAGTSSRNNGGCSASSAA